jgi:hypothetical protein
MWCIVPPVEASEIHSRVIQGSRRIVREIICCWILGSVAATLMFNSSDWLLCSIAGLIVTAPIFFAYRFFRFALLPPRR